MPLKIEIPGPMPKLILWMGIQEIFDVEKEMTIYPLEEAA